MLPGAPALVPELMGAAAAELDDVRAAGQRAIQQALAATTCPYVVVLGPAEQGGPSAPGRWAGRLSTADFGLDGSLPPLPGTADQAADPEVPTDLLGPRWLLGAVAARVPDEARWADLAWWPGRAGVIPAGPTVLVVVADGAACHGPKAPRAEDPRAAPYDDAVAAALEAGDPGRLEALDPCLGGELGASGAPLWPIVAGLLTGRRWDGQLLWAGHPYGVGYLVASWTPAPGG